MPHNVNDSELWQHIVSLHEDGRRHMSQATRSLRRVGFWRQVEGGHGHDPDDDSLPDPRLLVDPSWDPDVKKRVVDYLKRGWLPNYEAMGYSYCRFHCGIDDRLMGHREFTDGVWLWPEGFSHYVEVHSVRLPSEFLDHLQLRGFAYPNQVTDANFITQEDSERRWKSSELYQLMFGDNSKRDA